MKSRRQGSDRISALPQETIELILSLMPLRDAVRTSILSKKWRYCWTGIPKLEFDDDLVNESSDITEINKFKLVTAIFHVVLLHRAPISELRICIAEVDIVNQIDHIILHLSWTKNIKKLIFEITHIDRYYKIPSSLFSFQGLKHLDLGFCKFELPLTFNGFSMLKILVFDEVEITANVLKRFLTCCPLIEEFTLSAVYETKFTEGNTCTFVELFKCLPLVQVVKIARPYIKHLAAGCMSQKLSTSLVSLRIIEFDVSFYEQDEISSTLFVINNSPNLEKIKLTMVDDYVTDQTYTMFDPEEYSGLNLDRLKEVEITSFNNHAPEREFVKLIMAKSPVLKKATIKLDSYVSINIENKMIRDFLLRPFPRASPAAKLIIEHPKRYI